MVTAFVVDPGRRILLAKRAATMPTFPSHWAAISGSIEENEQPVSESCTAA